MVLAAIKLVDVDVEVDYVIFLAISKQRADFSSTEMANFIDDLSFNVKIL